MKKIKNPRPIPQLYHDLFDTVPFLTLGSMRAHIYLTNGNGFGWSDQGEIVSFIPKPSEKFKPQDPVLKACAKIKKQIFEYGDYSRPGEYLRHLGHGSLALSFPENISKEWTEDLISFLNDHRMHVEHCLAHYSMISREFIQEELVRINTLLTQLESHTARHMGLTLEEYKVRKEETNKILVDLIKEIIEEKRQA